MPADEVDLVRFVSVFLAEFGEALMPGDVNLSGSFCAVAVVLGVDRVARADFGPLGTVSIRRSVV